MNITTASIEDVIELIIDHRGKTPKKLGSDWTSSGHRVVSAKNIRNRRVDDNDHHYVDSATYARWMGEPLRGGDVLLTSEAPLGEVAYLKDDVDWVLGQRLFALRPDPNKLVGRFLYYLLQYGPVRHALESRATGTTVVGIKQAELRKVQLPLPNLSSQWEIAGLLGALDDKIESNQSAIHASRILKQASYKDLDKSDCLEKQISDVAEIVKGVSYKSVDMITSETKLFGLKCFERTGKFNRQGLRDFAGKYRPTQELCFDDICVAQTDLTQKAEVVGRTLMPKHICSDQRLVASLDVAIVRSLGSVPAQYLYGALDTREFREHCRSRVSGTTVLHLQSDAIKSFRIPIPNQDVMDLYAEKASILDAYIATKFKETALLSQLRDTLLPELMSGRMRVDEAQGLVMNALETEDAHV